MDKAAQLGEALGQLSTPEALALARAVELARLNGKEALPTDQVLKALRPRLREARAARVPTLRRMICTPLTPYLTDDVDEPRAHGRIPRAAIAPWWSALQRMAGAEIRALEVQLAECAGEGASGNTGGLAESAWKAAEGWTRALSEELAKPRPDPVLRQLFPQAALITDVNAIATVLALAVPLRDAFAAIDQVLAAADKLDGTRIIELTPDAVTVAKQHYLAISETQGMDGGFLALGLLNRLRTPWHILRLGRALSWKQNDALLRQTEFAAVGERLIQGLSHGAQEIVALAQAREVECGRIASAVAVYMEEAEGLLGEFGFRRDSSWGEAILQTRVTLSGAIGASFLARVTEQMLARVLPLERHSSGPRGFSPDPDLRAPPSDTAIAEASAAARLLILLVHRGTRHGLGQAARDAIDGLGTEFEKRISDLLDALRRTPDQPVVEAQIGAAAQTLDLLFEDGRGGTVIRRMRLAQQATA